VSRTEETERRAALHLRTLTGKTLQRILDEHAGHSAKDKGIRKMVLAEMRRRGPANDPGRKRAWRHNHAEFKQRLHNETPEFQRFVKRGGNFDFWNFRANKPYKDGTSRAGNWASSRAARAESKRLTAARRKHLRPSQFALVARRQLPLVDKAHVRNAAARLTQMKKRGTVTASEYRTAKRRILAAEKRFKIGPYRARKTPR
jgi:hypothetical protein